ncbi:hypothetical protein NPIL_529151 [Nephila pilipes]|uniref:Uncharacterized protein n=1 Tax=Nephila pilipes TaxID=299642 RepID=A0A8X6PR30_NEPPI|nr:hypothetical protein NPIL_529151 [Nephila pilipes]
MKHLQSTALPTELSTAADYCEDLVDVTLAVVSKQSFLTFSSQFHLTFTNSFEQQTWLLLETIFLCMDLSAEKKEHISLLTYVLHIKYDSFILETLLIVIGFYGNAICTLRCLLLDLQKTVFGSDRLKGL